MSMNLSWKVAFRTILAKTPGFSKTPIPVVEAGFELGTMFCDAFF